MCHLWKGRKTCTTILKLSQLWMMEFKCWNCFLFHFRNVLEGEQSRYCHRQGLSLLNDIWYLIWMLLQLIISTSCTLYRTKCAALKSQFIIIGNHSRLSWKTPWLMSSGGFFSRCHLIFMKFGSWYPWWYCSSPQTHDTLACPDVRGHQSTMCPFSTYCPLWLMSSASGLGDFAALVESLP